MKTQLLSAVVAGLVSLSLAVPTVAMAGRPQDSQVRGKDVSAAVDLPDGEQNPLLPNAYIVTPSKNHSLQSNTAEMATQTHKLAESARQIGARVFAEYDAVGGYAAQMTEEQLAKVQADPNVSVRPDRIRTVDGFEKTGPSHSLQAAKDHIEVTDANYEELMKRNDKVTIFYVGAWWCSTCVVWEPKIEKLNVDDNGSWRYAHLDVDKQKKAGEFFVNKWNQNEIPFMVAYRNGNSIGDKFLPRKSIPDARAWVDQVNGKVPPTTTPTPSPTSAAPTTAPTTKPTIVPPTTKPTAPSTKPTKPASTKPTQTTTKPTKPNPPSWPTWWPTKPTAKPTAPSTKPTSATTSPVTTKPAPTNQPGAVTWNLDVLDNRQGAKDGKFEPNGSGKGVNIYVVDSGVFKDHEDFKGRTVTDGFSALKNKPATSDMYGHGTHVASTAAGNKYGVAKEATIVPVRFLDEGGRGTDSGFVESINWVVKNAKKPAIMNASWGNDAKDDPKGEMDQLVKSVVDAGITVVAAAGNEGKDACSFTPARMSSVITVSAMDTDLSYYRFNFGKCVQVMAPGRDIVAASSATMNATRSMQGTSMAAPHVSGAAAVYLGSHPNATPSEVQKALLDNATSGLLKNLPQDTPNKLVYVGK